MHRRTYLSAVTSLWAGSCATLRDEQPSSLPDIPDIGYWTVVAKVARGRLSLSRAEVVRIVDEVNLGRATKREATGHLRLVSKGEFEPEEVVPKWWLELQRQLGGARVDYREQRWSVEDGGSDSIENPSRS
ncbi:hypothetical protein [Halobacteriaceae bacterium SHR40]|uniref:hypothetical protein n=1 Tax=Halovenus amylolytica TaxID=2500550 RepID=UPI000FE316E0